MRAAAVLVVLLACAAQAQDVDMSADIEVGSKRSPTRAMNEFRRQTGFQQGRPGWVIDHIVPMCAGGPDSVGNLQWQDRATSYRKDVFERQLCAAMKREGLIIVKRDEVR